MVGKQARVAGIAAAGFDQFGQRQRVAQAEVEALRADRMQGLCGIADQHRARRDGLPGHRADGRIDAARADRKEAGSEEHTSELQSLMRISYAVFCLKKKKVSNRNTNDTYPVTNTTHEHQPESLTNTYEEKYQID